MTTHDGVFRGLGGSASHIANAERFRKRACAASEAFLITTESRERLIEIFDNIVDVLNSDGETNHVG